MDLTRKDGDEDPRPSGIDGIWILASDGRGQERIMAFGD